MNKMLEQAVNGRTLGTRFGAYDFAAGASSLGRAGIAHDLNNLLTPVIWMLDSLRTSQPAAPGHRQRIEGAIACAERARSLVRQLSEITTQGQPVSVVVGARDLLSDLKKIFLCALGTRISLVFDTGQELPAININREQIERALLNLIVNARDAMPDGGTVTIAAHTEFRPATHPGQVEMGIRISISDTGDGMNEVTLGRAAMPFFSTKPTGSGLGLALSRTLIEQLRGEMTIASAPGLGTTIDIWLPAASSAACG